MKLIGRATRIEGNIEEPEAGLDNSGKGQHAVSISRSRMWFRDSVAFFRCCPPKGQVSLECRLNISLVARALTVVLYEVVLPSTFFGYYTNR